MRSSLVRKACPLNPGLLRCNKTLLRFKSASWLPMHRWRTSKESLVANTLSLSSQTLRQQLMAPQAIERVHALHALEREADHADAQVAKELQAFTSRGLPYYAPQDPAYQKWVNRAVGYWDKLHPN
jgi:hypothetical protein